ncbi:hypothetical protein [Acaryochloris marina]|uniref:Uncharacterized protein n=1 Tax=Acaryochloris marina (strain MBIC 11017) TaxID=329726 RepID=B0C122_ACAM1|nr:hypothetical protein [Acaryochloris marina]ABW27281.1 hypothetical protein AM1_2270 [Acaryochloris marina MBIC11017]BDM82027.1 hypothetical protein AM10699_48910 [Acaryochloris marina MBIC10699]
MESELENIICQRIPYKGWMAINYMGVTLEPAIINNIIECDLYLSLWLRHKVLGERKDHSLASDTGGEYCCDFWYARLNLILELYKRSDVIQKGELADLFVSWSPYLLWWTCLCESAIREIERIVCELPIRKDSFLKFHTQNSPEDQEANPPHDGIIPGRLPQLSSYECPDIEIQLGLVSQNHNPKENEMLLFTLIEKEAKIISDKDTSFQPHFDNYIREDRKLIYRMNRDPKFSFLNVREGKILESKRGRPRHPKGFGNRK